MPIGREIDERERPPHARTRPASGPERPRLLPRRARHRATGLCPADAGDPRRPRRGDRSRLRRRAARSLSVAAALDGLLAVRRRPPLPGADPVVLDQDLVVALDPARGANIGSPSLRAKLIEALGPKPRERIVHVGAGATTIAQILAELVDPAGRVPAVEFDAAMAERGKTFLSGRSNVRIVHGDGARWPETSADGVYVNFAVSRPADCWIEGLAPGGRLVFPLGVPGPQRANSGGRHSDRGAALRIERRGDAYAARAVSTAYFVCAEGEFEADREELERLRAAFEAGGIDTVRSLSWKRPALSHRCWFAGKDWALSRDETP